MMYTIIPQEEIWNEDITSTVEQNVTVDGCVMQVQPVDAANGVVTRILSTDPQDFLNLRFQPGSLVPLSQDQY